jgi:hypothetical protein
VGFIDGKLIVTGNNAATVNNIMENELLFRIRNASELILYTFVVVLSFALYVILKKVNKNLALLALILRLVEGILGVVTVLISFTILSLLNGKGSSAVFETEQLPALVGLFINVSAVGLDIVLIFVGLGGAIFCYLFFKSRYIPGILAAWGILTYLSMLILASVSILSSNLPESIRLIFYVPGGLFEIIIGLWLFLKGINVEKKEFS